MSNTDEDRRSVLLLRIDGVPHVVLGPLFYDCASTSTRQHNEPAGNHDVWHLYAHVFPRHHEDRLYERDREARWVGAEERASEASVLADVLCLPRTFT